MPDDGGEQQELSDVGAEPLAETWQERILRYYNSPKIHHIAVGFWLKLVTEAAIVSLPLAVFVITPGAIASQFGVGPLGFRGYIVAWGTLTVTILGFAWCLTESNGEDISRTSEEESESESD